MMTIVRVQRQGRSGVLCTVGRPISPYDSRGVTRIHDKAAAVLMRLLCTTHLSHYHEWDQIPNQIPVVINEVDMGAATRERE